MDVEMNIQVNLSSGQNDAMVMLAFLQADCRNPEYKKELISLSEDLNLIEDGDIETDSCWSRGISAVIRDIQPSVELHQPGGDHVDARAIRQMAEELREIAALLEHNVVAQATQNLSRNIDTFPLNDWKTHISSAVDSVMRQGMYLNDLPQERVVMALTFTLVKGVCEQNPLRLRNLFNSALQYISQARPR